MRGNTEINGRYTLRRVLGSGGAAEVWLAEDKRLSRSVALKILRPEHATNNELLQRFHNEAKTVTQLNSPHIVQVYDVGVDQVTSRPFIVMEYIEGTTLEGWGRRHPPVEEVLETFLAIAQGIAVSHKRNIVHRDLKPTNILRASDGQIKITDFGIARYLQDPRLTKENHFWGTLLYASPEQLMGADVKQPGDIYSLGIMLFEALAGHPPFAGEGIKLIDAHRNAPVPDTLSRDARLPKDLTTLVTKMLTKDPNQRYPRDGAGLVKELQRLKRLVASRISPGSPDITQGRSVNPPPFPSAPTRMMQAVVSKSQVNFFQLAQELRTIVGWLTRKGREGYHALAQAASNVRQGSPIQQEAQRATQRAATRTRPLVIATLTGAIRGMIGGFLGGAIGGVGAGLIHTALHWNRFLESWQGQDGALQQGLLTLALNWSLGPALVGLVVGAAMGVMVGLILGLRGRNFPTLQATQVVRTVRAALEGMPRGALYGAGYRLIALVLGFLARVFGLATESAVFSASSGLTEQVLGYAIFGLIGWALFRAVDGLMSKTLDMWRGSFLGSLLISALEGAICLASGAVIYTLMQQYHLFDPDALVGAILRNDIQLLTRFDLASAQATLGALIGSLVGIYRYNQRHPHSQLGQGAIR